MSQSLYEEADATVGKKLASELLWSPLRRMWSQLTGAIVALLVISMSHAALLFLVGPLMTAMIQGEQEAITLSDLVPQSIITMFNMPNVAISIRRLQVYIPLLLVVVALFKSLATYFYQLYQNEISLQVAAHYRQRLFQAILNQSYLEIVKKTVGEWMSVVMNDVHFIQARFSELTGALIKDCLIVMTAGVTLAFIHWPSALLLIAISPIAMLTMGRIGRRISQFAEAWQQELGKFAGKVLSMRERMDFIKVHGGEAWECQEFDASNQRYYQQVKKSLFIRSAFAPWLEFMGVLAFAACAMAIFHGIWFDALTAGQMFQLFAAVGILMRPLRNIGEQMSRLQESLGALRQSLEVFKAFERSRAAAKREQSKSRSRLPESWNIEKLVAGIEGQVLSQIKQAKLVSGRAIAIVGPSGAGKSTLIRTLAGLIPPIEWEADVGWAQLIENVAFVSQKPFLFTGTIRDNLEYGLKEEASDEKLTPYLKDMGLEEEVIRHPQGLGRSIHALQGGLSGGQIQRLVLTRALLRERQVLILDEATSALDEGNEGRITKALLDLTRHHRQILLAVTHRLRWLELFDEVWFLEQGEVRFRGHHTDLLQESRYRSFVSTQPLE